MYVVIIVLLLVGSTKAHISCERWQCYVPSTNAVYDLVRQDTKDTFDVTGPAVWMTEKRPYISCYEVGLMKVPGVLQQDVEILNLNRNLITHIHENAFENYPSLIALFLAENCVYVNFYESRTPKCSMPFLKVSPNAFFNLNKLKYLDLSGNSLISMPENLPKSLLVLDIFFTNIGPITKFQVANLTNLELVLFSSNCVGGDLQHLCKGNLTINNLEFSSHNLSFLDLSYNNIPQIPNWLFTTSLIGINLRGNPMRTVQQSDFAKCGSLIELHFSWTSRYDRIPLTLFPGAFNGLVDLKYLDLSGNMISSLPYGFLADSIKLETLKLAFNCLKSWVENPIGLPYTAIKYLDLTGNTFCSNELFPMKPKFSKLKLGESYKNLSRLETLMLGAPVNPTNADVKLFWFVSYGALYDRVDNESLEVLQSLPHLKQFSLSFSGIRTLEINAFCGLNLISLNLGINEIGININSSLTTKRFKRNAAKIRSESNFYQPRNNIPRAQYFNLLQLQRNAIVNLEEYPLGCFKSISYLDLSYNRINYIHNYTFEHLLHLQVLDLQYNPIRHIDSNSFNSLASLNHLLFNFTDFQEQFTLKFLLGCPQNLSMKFGDFTTNMFRLLAAYRNNYTCFESIYNLSVCNVPIPAYDILHNIPVFSPFPNLLKMLFKGIEINYPLGNKFFGGVTRLQNLTMIHCAMQEYPFRAVEPLRQLIFLDLSFNRIQKIERSWFSKTQNLKTLILSHNFIKTIMPGTFQIMADQGIDRIDLSNNYVTDVGLKVIDKRTLQKLKYLDLRRNRLTCDCSMSRSFGWFIQFSDKHLLIPGFVPLCSDAVDDYYGGCLSCATGTSIQQSSLFLYSSSFICQETFLQTLTVVSNMIIFLLLVMPLVSKTKILKKALVRPLVRSVIRQVFETKERNQEYIELTDKVYSFDAVICFDTEDTNIADWVDHVMIPKLENSSPSFRVAIMGKEDWCGTTRVQQLLLRMESSRKTIVLLTDKFSRTPQCRYILSVLEEKIFTSGKDKSLVISFNQRLSEKKLKIRRHRNVLSVLNYPGLHQNDSDNIAFWEMLKLSLSVSNNLKVSYE